MSLSSENAKFTVKIKQLLLLSVAADKDERYMAISDLITQLDSFAGIVEDDLQVSIKDAIILSLDDKSADVQTIAVSCLSALVKKFAQQKIVDIGEKLGAKLLSGLGELRDIYAMGITTLINSLPKEFGATFGVKIAGILIDGLSRKLSIAEETLVLHMVCIDLVKELVTRFGALVTIDKLDALLNLLLQLLHAEKLELRKRVSTTLGIFSSVLSERSFKLLIETLIKNIESVDKKEDSVFLFIFIQTIGSLSRNAGSRIGRYLGQIVPLLARFCDYENLLVLKFNSKALESGQELAENCLQAFEAIITQCPNEVFPHLNQISSIALKYIEFDPNYTYDYENAMETEPAADAWEDDTAWNDDIAEFNVASNDDDDSSWKVRRAATRVISAFLSGKDETLVNFFDSICACLVSKFRERVSSVKIEIMLAFRNMLVSSCSAVPRDGIDAVSPTPAARLARSDSEPPEPACLRRTVSAVREQRYASTLTEALPKIITSLKREYDASDSKVRAAIFSVLQPLFERFPTHVVQFFPLIIPTLIAALSDKDNALRSGALLVLNAAYSFRTAIHLAPFATSLVPSLLACIKDSYPKICADGLRLSAVFSKSLINNDDVVRTDSLKKLFGACFSSLLLQDVGQEIKELSLYAVSNLLSNFNSEFASELSKVLDVFIERLKNEVTRLSALKAIQTLMEHGSDANWSQIQGNLESILVEIGPLLRKNSQHLKQESLLTLIALVSIYSKYLKISIIKPLLLEASSLLKDDDLQVAQLTLKFLDTIAVRQPTLISSFQNDVFPKILVFLRSPLLQGDILSNLRSFFRHLVTAKFQELNYDVILNALITTASEDISKQAASNVSQCVAAIVIASTPETIYATVNRFFEVIQNSASDFKSLRISILALGEIGRIVDLSGNLNIENILFGLLQNGTEEIKSIAAISLGSVTVGNVSFFLPLLLKRLSTSPDRVYLLLTSIKEFVVVLPQSGKAELAVQQFKLSEKLLPLLLEQAENKDEGVRSMVSECIGKLASIDSDVYSVIRDRICACSPFTRSTIVASLKFCLAKTSGLAFHFPQILPLFVKLLKDIDINVRRQAFLTLNAIIYSAFVLIKLDFHSIYECINAETKPHEELIRVINFGPIDRRVDDGFPLRKAAFQCLDTILDVTSEGASLEVLLPNIRDGVEDEETDIQILAYLILHKIALSQGSQLLDLIDTITESIKKNMIARIKGSREAEPDKHLDVLRSAVRALNAITKVPGYETTTQFYPFFKQVLQTQLLKDMMKVENERNGTA